MGFEPMIKKLLSSVREYKKDTILAPVYVTLESILEIIIPTLMAFLIDRGISQGNMENITAFVVATLSFYTVGFALMFGKSLFGLVGTSYWLLFHLNSQYDYIFVLYQMMLAATSITIFAGSMQS